MRSSTVASLARRAPEPRRATDELDLVVAAAPGAPPAPGAAAIAAPNASGAVLGGPAAQRADRGAAGARLVWRAGDGVRHVHGAGRHPDRYQLANPDSGRAVGQPGRDQLGADLVSDRRSGDDPAVRHAEPAVVASAVGSTITSALCAGATSLEAMIVYRVLQGFLGGAMIPTVFPVVYGLF